MKIADLRDAVWRSAALQPVLTALGVGIICFVGGVELGRATAPRPAPASATPVTPAPVPSATATEGTVVSPVQLLPPITPDQVSSARSYGPKWSTAKPTATPTARPDSPSVSAPQTRAPERVTTASRPRALANSTATAARPTTPTAPAPVAHVAVTAPRSPSPAPAADRGVTAPTRPVARAQAAPAKTSGYAIQVASLKDQKWASEQAGQLSRRGIPVFIESADLGKDGVWYRVLAGTFASEAEAQRVLATLRRDPQFAASFVRAY